MVKLDNITKEKIFGNEIVFCRSAFSKATGLMFRKIKNKAMVFFFEKERRISLHMFFVFSQIDVIFLDKERKVIEIKKRFRSFRFYKSKKKISYVIELPEGTIDKNNIELGNRIDF